MRFKTRMIRLKKITAIALISLVAVLAIAAPAVAQRGGQSRDFALPRSNPQFLAAFREAMAEAAQSTARVLCDGKDAALGTIVTEDGWILTKFSLLSGKVSCKLKDGSTYEAKIVGAHE